MRDWPKSLSAEPLRRPEVPPSLLNRYRFFPCFHSLRLPICVSTKRGGIREPGRFPGGTAWLSIPGRSRFLGPSWIYGRRWIFSARPRFGGEGRKKSTSGTILGSPCYFPTWGESVFRHSPWNGTEKGNGLVFLYTGSTSSRTHFGVSATGPAGPSRDSRLWAAGQEWRASYRQQWKPDG